MSPKTFYVGVKAVVRVGNTCLLLLKHTKEGKSYWDIPGGRMHEGESVEETLRREVEEELPGFKDYKIYGLLGAYPLEDNLPDGNGLFFITHKLTAEPFDVMLSSEHADYRWVTKDELDALKREPGQVPLNSHYAALVKAFE